MGEEVKYGKVVIKLLSEDVDEGVVKRRLELAPTVKVVSTLVYTNKMCTCPLWPGFHISKNDLFML